MNQQPELRNLLHNPAEEILAVFKLIQKMYRDQLCEKAKQYGFTGPQMGVLAALHKKPFSNLNEVSEFLGLSKSTVSGIVDRLVAQGAVVREIPADNRRIVRLSLSEEFRNNNILAELKNKYMSEALQQASDDQLEKIIIGLDTLHQLLQKNLTGKQSE